MANNIKRHILSKSTFLRGVNCKKSLWLNKYHKELKDPISASQQALFDKGNRVGNLALQLFPNGKDATPNNFWDYRPSISKTIDWIQEGQKVIYEAAFQYDGVLSALDIFVQNDNNEYLAYEVKSSTGIKDYQLLDAALQYYVMSNSGYTPTDFFLVTINKNFVKNGEIDAKQFFSIESVLEKIIALQEIIQQKITECKYTLAIKQQPSIKIGPHCTEPHTCDFKGHCWSHIPQYSIFDISRIGSKVWELYEQGFLETTDIPEGLESISETQKIQITADKKNKNIINKPNIQNFLNAIEYPIFYMDFETFGPAIPIYNGTSPYKNIPVQYSIHKSLDESNKNLNHLEFLAKPDIDPRKAFINSLIADLEKNGSIIVYNKGFENMILNNCKEYFPNLLEQIELIQSRIIDLMDVFKSKDYYTPDMQGSYSIKKVLPALVPKLNYNDLAINSGDLASTQFETMILDPKNPNNQIIRQHLLEYCEQDTLAMVEIVKVLQEAVS